MFTVDNALDRLEKLRMEHRPADLPEESIFFTGWKGLLPGFENIYMTDGKMEVDVQAMLVEPVFVAQWIWRDPERAGPNLYVNLPGMEHGGFLGGESFDIGTARVRLGAASEELERLEAAGLALLREDVARYLGKGSAGATHR